MTTNPYKDRFNNIKIISPENNSGQEIIFSHNTIENVEESSYPIFMTTISSSANIMMNDNTFTNVSASSGIISFQTLGTITAERTIFQDISNFGGNIFQFMDSIAITIDGLTLNNISETEKSSFGYIYSTHKDPLAFSLINLELTNTNLNKIPVLFLSDPVSSFTFTDSVLRNVSVYSETSLFEISSLDSIMASNLSFTDILEDSDTANDNFLFQISTLNLNSTQDSSMTDIELDNWLIAFFEFDHISYTTSATRRFQLQNISVKNASYSRSINMFYFTEMITDQDFSISLTNITFEDLNFRNGGNLFFLSCQISNGVMMDQLILNNITGGRIHAQAYKPSESILASFTISNITTNSINAEYGSLIELKEGSVLILENSEIETITSYREGSVLSLEGEGTAVTVSNTVFKNNTAYEGGVFSVKSHSSLILDNWTLSHNFALQGGIISLSSEGDFAIKDTLISENYAIAMPVGFIFDTTEEAEINHCQIESNSAMTKEEFLNELNTDCALLWFVVEGFKNYINNNLGKINNI